MFSYVVELNVMFVLSQIFGLVTDRSAILKRCIGKKLSAKVDIEIFHIILGSFSLKMPRDHECLLHTASSSIAIFPFSTMP